MQRPLFMCGSFHSKNCAENRLPCKLKAEYPLSFVKIAPNISTESLIYTVLRLPTGQASIVYNPKDESYDYFKQRDLNGCRHRENF
jgi:hypothetical protein